MGYLAYMWTIHGIFILYPFISVDLVHKEIFHAQVGKGGISWETSCELIITTVITFIEIR